MDRPHPPNRIKALEPHWNRRQRVAGIPAPVSWGRRAVFRILVALVGIIAAVGFGGQIASMVFRPGPGGAPRCEADPDATTNDYLLGSACPPYGFARALGYEPVLVGTPHGWRYTKPAWANGNCSGPLVDTGPFWDFTMACETHDYGYDLVRFGIGERAQADALLHRDMLASCRGQWLSGVVACRGIAQWARVVLGLGDGLGFDPAPMAAPIATDEVSAAATERRPDIVLILTDDQRFDTLWAMPTVQSELVAKGIQFTRGYVSNALCCPSRTSILTGQYSHSTGVYTNKSQQPHGGFSAFRDRSTVATWLQDAGYRTAMLGKYLNGYKGTYVPPGWDRWFATWDEGGFYGYTANSAGAVSTFGDDPTDYGTDVLARRATNFIRTTEPARPLFLYFAPHAPHGPATPAPGDGRAFSDLAPWRPPSYDEAHVAEKPAYIRAEPRLSGTAAAIDRFRLDQYRSLLAVDRAVEAILDALADTGRLSNAMIVFMSDNGMLWGEHRWHKKLVPYEESIRVPLVVRADALIAEPRSDRHLVLNIDLAPTFARLAGIGAPGVEGRSLLPLLSSPTSPWRSDFLLEHMKMGEGGVPTYCGVHSGRFVYVDYVTGEEELYNLARDPHELSNKARKDSYRDILRVMRRRLVELCDPLPPGFAFSF